MATVGLPNDSGALFKVTILGEPGEAAINAARRHTNRGTSYKSTKAKRFEARAAEAFAEATLLDPNGAAAVRGLPTVTVRVTTYWPRQRHLDNVEELGLGDVDAPVKACLDALERAGIVDNDVRVVKLEATKHYDKDLPRIVIEVFPPPFPNYDQ